MMDKHDGNSVPRMVMVAFFWAFLCDYPSCMYHSLFEGNFVGLPFLHVFTLLPILHEQFGRSLSRQVTFTLICRVL